METAAPYGFNPLRTSVVAGHLTEAANVAEPILMRPLIGVLREGADALNALCVAAVAARRQLMTDPTAYYLVEMIDEALEKAKYI